MKAKEAVAILQRMIRESGDQKLALTEQEIEALKMAIKKLATSMF